MNPPFSRTVCACADCASHCKRQPGPLAPGDFERIASKMQLPAEQAAAFFRASPGALVRDSQTGLPRRIGTIVPATTDAGGRCVFLDQNDQCLIHDVAPFGCAYFDHHMPARIAYPRTVWYLRAVDASPDYARIRSALKYCTTHNPNVW